MSESYEFFIIRTDDRISTLDLKCGLEKENSWDRSIELKTSSSGIDIRPADPTLLSAIAAGSAAIGALFGALGGVAQSLGKHKITVRWQDGTTVEVDGRRAEEILKRVIPLLSEKPDKKVVISI